MTAFLIFCLALTGKAFGHDVNLECHLGLAPDDRPIQAQSTRDARIVVIGGGASGAISKAMIEGVQRFQRRHLSTTFLTASRSQQAPWPGSSGHQGGIDRNDEKTLDRLIAQTQPTVLIDAAEAHMADALHLPSIEAARDAGRTQARMLTRHLLNHPERALLFISSQYASSELKDITPVDKRFDVVGIAEPVPVRLYAEMKEAYEAELLAQYKAGQISNFVILRLGTLLSPDYRAKSVEALIAAGGKVKGKHFTPEPVLSDSLLAVLESLKKQSPVSRILEISSKNDFNDVKGLGLRIAPLTHYVQELKKAWAP